MSYIYAAFAQKHGEDYQINLTLSFCDEAGIERKVSVVGCDPDMGKAQKQAMALALEWLEILNANTGGAISSPEKGGEVVAIPPPTESPPPLGTPPSPPTVDPWDEEPQKFTAPPPALPRDISEIIAETTRHLRRLGWTDREGRAFLEANYGGKRSRSELSQEELLDFLQYLKNQNPA